MEANDKNPGDTKWNNEQELNEGFSARNLPENYDPSQKPADLMHSETETDQFGNDVEVKRARFPHDHDSRVGFDDNHAIENKKSLENRDRNYDVSANRYPDSHRENHENRGNFDVNES